MTHERLPSDLEAATWKRIGDLLSYDLRTSLTTVSGFLELLLSAPGSQTVDDRAELYALYIRKEMNRMMDLIEAFDIIRRSDDVLRKRTFRARQWLERLRPGWLRDDDWRVSCEPAAEAADVHGDSYALQTVMRLLQHYVYASPGKSSGLHVAARSEAGKLHVTIGSIRQRHARFDRERLSASGADQSALPGREETVPSAFDAGTIGLYVRTVLAAHDGELDWGESAESMYCRVSLPHAGRHM